MAKSIERVKIFRVFFDRYRPIILTIAGLIVFVGGYFLLLERPLSVYRENLGQLNKLDSDIAAAKAALVSAQNYADKIYQPTAAEKNLLAMALPSQPDYSSLVEHLTVLAGRAGFIVNHINVETTNGRAGDKVAGSNLGKLSVQLQVSGGNYPQLKQLIGLLESSVMMIDVSSINFSSKAPNYDLDLIVYYYHAN